MLTSEVIQSGQTFYHGTKTTEAAKSILKHGLRPGNVDKMRRGLATPLLGRVYLTPNLDYAVIYAIGGNVAGGGPSTVKWMVEKSGRYGYLFTISGEELLDHLIPDEDSVGEAVMFADNILNKNARSAGLYSDNAMYVAMADPANRRRVEIFFHNARSGMTKRQFENSLDGLIAYQAAGGKRALKVMPDETKKWLLQWGAHASYEGTIIPETCWRFDRRHIPLLKKDASNFFELAKKIY